MMANNNTNNNNSSGRKKNSKGKNYKYAIAYQDSMLNIKYRIYFKTYADLNKVCPIGSTTLNNILKKDGKTKKYRWCLFERVEIKEDLGDFWNKNPDKQKNS